MLKKKNKITFKNVILEEESVEIHLYNNYSKQDYTLTIDSDFFSEECYKALKEWDSIRDGKLVVIDKDQYGDEIEILKEFNGFDEELPFILEDQKLSAELCEYVMQSLIKVTEWR